MLDVIDFKRAASLWRLSDAWGLKAIMNLSKKKKKNSNWRKKKVFHLPQLIA